MFVRRNLAKIKAGQLNFGLSSELSKQFYFKMVYNRIGTFLLWLSKNGASEQANSKFKISLCQLYA
jgi:hypothetical protein